jgi:hypothetical protein
LMQAVGGYGDSFPPVPLAEGLTMDDVESR